MTDDVAILRKALSKYEDALRMKNMNRELLQHLTDSVFYLIKHAEKYNLPLPKKDELIRMVDKANFLIDQITEPTNRKFTDRKYTADYTEPYFGCCQVYV